MSDLILDLDGLSPEERESVERLAQKFRQRNEKGVDEKPKQQKNKRRDRSTKKQTGRSQGRSGPRNARPENRVRRKDRPSKGGMARTEPVQLTGENKFDSMQERFKHKDDVAIDKKLWGKNRRAERREQYEDVEAQCQVCKLWYDVNPSLIYSEDGAQIFTCHNCTPKGR